MASNAPISVDPRTISPLVSSPFSPLGDCAIDTLYDTAHCLGLFADLIGNAGPDSVLMQSKDHKFALLLQLQGMVSVLEAVADALLKDKIGDGPRQVRVELSLEELGQLRTVADMGRRSVDSLAQEVLSEYCATLRAAFGTHPSPKND